MVKYWRIYKEFIRLNLSMTLAFRANVINSIISSFIWSTFHVATILLLTSKASYSYSWSSDELILLTGTFTFTWAIFHMIFARNFDRMSETIDAGNLDMILLKPLDSQFLLTMNQINFAGIVRLAVGLVVIVYQLSKMHITLSFFTLTAYLILIALGVLLIYSVWMIVCTSLIWLSRLSNLVDFLFYISGMSRYPPDMLDQVKALALFFLPFIIFVSLPTKVLLQKLSWGDILLMAVFTGISFYIARQFWRFALRSYTSASS